MDSSKREGAVGRGHEVKRMKGKAGLKEKGRKVGKPRKRRTGRV